MQQDKYSDQASTNHSALNELQADFQLMMV